MKRVTLILFAGIALLAIYLWWKRSVPYENELQTQQITIDSTTITGPVVLIYDKRSRQSFWLKSYTSFDAEEFDSLKGKAVRIHYMKFLVGPFENRIFKMEVDSVVVFNQAVESN